MLSRARTLRGMADAMVAADLERMYQAPEQWRVLLLLERRITEPAVYQEMFHFVGKLADGFSAAEDLPPDVDPRPLAFVAFSTMNGIIRDTMQVLDVMPDRDMLLRVVQRWEASPRCWGTKTRSARKSVRCAAADAGFPYDRD